MYQPRKILASENNIIFSILDESKESMIDSNNLAKNKAPRNSNRGIAIILTGATRLLDFMLCVQVLLESAACN